MKTKILVSVLFAIALKTLVMAQPDQYRLSYYAYFTNDEETVHGEIIWFWTRDTLYGITRSNDFIGLMYSPTFYGRVMSARGFWYYQRGNIDTSNLSICAPLRMPRSFPHISALATNSFYSDNGRYYTHIVFEGENGAIVKRGRLGLGNFEDEEEVDRLENRDDSIIYVEGKLEVEGVVDGRVTLYATGEIGLPNDLRYNEANRLTGDFNENDPSMSMLGVVSEENIIIRNTVANGRANGRQVGGNDWNRHSIVLNGTYMALGESFTFEDQNDDWNAYQGPTPDERGWIYLKGNTVQGRRGYVHRANHTGTGYTKAYRFDYRLALTAPPGLMREENPHFEDEFERLTIRGGEKYLDGVTIGDFFIEGGAVFHLKSGDALTVRDTMVARGTAETPIRFIATEYSRITLAESALLVSLDHVHFEGNVEIVCGSESFRANNCLFGGDVQSTGTTTLDSCRFEQELSIHASGEHSVTRTVLTQGLAVANRQSVTAVSNCTILGGNHAGVSIQGGEAVLSNSIIASGRNGVVCERDGSATINYCDVYDNGRDYLNCQPGEGCLSADPDFVDQRNGNLSLLPGSPCIDAGDPASPRDPDGTVADLGAYWLDRGLGDADGDDGDADGGGGLSASPNPFNATTVIRFEGSPINREATIKIIDLQGRVVFSTNALLHSSTTALIWDATAFPAGIYIVKVGTGKEAQTMKIVKVN